MLRRELPVEVEMDSGHYGEFAVLVDGEEVINGGALAFLGVLPSVAKVKALVEERLRRG